MRKSFCILAETPHKACCSSVSLQLLAYLKLSGSHEERISNMMTCVYCAGIGFPLNGLINFGLSRLAASTRK